MEKRPDEVAGMFSDVAPAYDRTNLMLSMGNSALWRVAVQRAIDPKPGERILDVAAGTGASSASLARNGASVVALDFSAGMIEEWRKRNPKIEFVEGDAEKLPFGDDAFDVVTISFGLRNVANPKAALAEMYRVLKPGGRLMICEFSHPPQALVRGGYELYLRRAMPVIAKVSSSNPDAYTYLAESIADWPDQGTLSQWIRGVGFTRVAHRNLTGGIVALHRGVKPADPVIRAATAQRRRQRTAPTDSAG
jgi:demethylmenaquinone methyltransferase/2-methoxy-6-polyprenyl-1,4-benzoquinol methylase